MSGSSNGKVRIVTCAAAFVLVLILSGSLAPLSEEEAQAQSPGGSDIAFSWAEQFGTSASDGARSVAVDPSDGSPVVAGVTNGSLDPAGKPVDPATPPSDLPQMNVNRGGEDYFIRKHGSDGAWKWTPDKER